MLHLPIPFILCLWWMDEALKDIRGRASVHSAELGREEVERRRSFGEEGSEQK